MSTMRNLKCQSDTINQAADAKKFKKGQKVISTIENVCECSCTGEGKDKKLNNITSVLSVACDKNEQIPKCIKVNRDSAQDSKNVTTVIVMKVETSLEEINSLSKNMQLVIEAKTIVGGTCNSAKEIQNIEVNKSGIQVTNEIKTQTSVEKTNAVIENRNKCKSLSNKQIENDLGSEERKKCVNNPKASTKEPRDPIGNNSDCKLHNKNNQKANGDDEKKREKNKEQEIGSKETEGEKEKKRQEENEPMQPDEPSDCTTLRDHKNLKNNLTCSDHEVQEKEKKEIVNTNGINAEDETVKEKKKKEEMESKTTIEQEERERKVENEPRQPEEPLDCQTTKHHNKKDEICTNHKVEEIQNKDDIPTQKTNDDDRKKNEKKEIGEIGSTKTTEEKEREMQNEKEPIHQEELSDCKTTEHLNKNNQTCTNDKVEEIDNKEIVPTPKTNDDEGKKNEKKESGQKESTETTEEEERGRQKENEPIPQGELLDCTNTKHHNKIDQNCTNHKSEEIDNKEVVPTPKTNDEYDKKIEKKKNKEIGSTETTGEEEREKQKEKEPIRQGEPLDCTTTKHHNKIDHTCTNHKTEEIDNKEIVPTPKTTEEDEKKIEKKKNMEIGSTETTGEEEREKQKEKEPIRQGEPLDCTTTKHHNKIDHTCTNHKTEEIDNKEIVPTPKTTEEDEKKIEKKKNMEIGSTETTGEEEREKQKEKEPIRQGEPLDCTTTKHDNKIDHTCTNHKTEEIDNKEIVHTPKTTEEDEKKIEEKKNKEIGSTETTGEEEREKQKEKEPIRQGEPLDCTTTKHHNKIDETCTNHKTEEIDNKEIFPTPKTNDDEEKNNNGEIGGAERTVQEEREKQKEKEPIQQGESLHCSTTEHHNKIDQTCANHKTEEIDNKEIVPTPKTTEEDEKKIEEKKNKEIGSTETTGEEEREKQKEKEPIRQGEPLDCTTTKHHNKIDHTCTNHKTEEIENKEIVPTPKTTEEEEKKIEEKKNKEIGRTETTGEEEREKQKEKEPIRQGEPLDCTTTKHHNKIDETCTNHKTEEIDNKEIFPTPKTNDDEEKNNNGEIGGAERTVQEEREKQKEKEPIQQGESLHCSTTEHHNKIDQTCANHKSEEIDNKEIVSTPKTNHEDEENNEKKKIGEIESTETKVQEEGERQKEKESIQQGEPSDCVTTTKHHNRNDETCTNHNDGKGKKKELVHTKDLNDKEEKEKGKEKTENKENKENEKMIKPGKQDDEAECSTKNEFESINAGKKDIEISTHTCLQTQNKIAAEGLKKPIHNNSACEVESECRNYIKEKIQNSEINYDTIGQPTNKIGECERKKYEETNLALTNFQNIDTLKICFRGKTKQLHVLHSTDKADKKPFYPENNEEKSTTLCTPKKVIEEGDKQCTENEDDLQNQIFLESRKPGKNYETPQSKTKDGQSSDICENKEKKNIFIMKKCQINKKTEIFITNTHYNNDVEFFDKNQIDQVADIDVSRNYDKKLPEWDNEVEIDQVADIDVSRNYDKKLPEWDNEVEIDQVADIDVSRNYDKKLPEWDNEVEIDQVADIDVSRNYDKKLPEWDNELEIDQVADIDVSRNYDKKLPEWDNEVEIDQVADIDVSRNYDKKLPEWDNEVEIDQVADIDVSRNYDKKLPEWDNEVEIDQVADIDVSRNYDKKLPEWDNEVEIDQVPDIDVSQNCDKKLPEWDNEVEVITCMEETDLESEPIQTLIHDENVPSSEIKAKENCTFTSRKETDNEENCNKKGSNDTIPLVNTKTNVEESAQPEEYTSSSKVLKTYRDYSQYLLYNSKSNLSLKETTENKRKMHNVDNVNIYLGGTSKKQNKKVKDISCCFFPGMFKGIKPESTENLSKISSRSTTNSTDEENVMLTFDSYSLDSKNAVSVFLDQLRAEANEDEYLKYKSSGDSTVLKDDGLSRKKPGTISRKLQSEITSKQKSQSKPEPIKELSKLSLKSESHLVNDIPVKEENVMLLTFNSYSLDPENASSIFLNKMRAEADEDEYLKYNYTKEGGLFGTESSPGHTERSRTTSTPTIIRNEKMIKKYKIKQVNSKDNNKK